MLQERFECSERGRIKLVYNPRLVTSGGLAFLETLPQLLRDMPAHSSRAPGLGTVWELPPQEGLPMATVARQYVHGGFCGRSLGALRVLFPGPGPMLRELCIATHLIDCGVPASNPVALRLERKAGPLLTAMLVTEKIGGALNLLQLCQRISAGYFSLTGNSKRHLLERIASLAAAMHEAGVFHGDLNLKNILVRFGEKWESGEEFYVIDFKKAHLTGPVEPEKGVRNLRRLWRSVRKWPDSAAVFGPEDLRTLLNRYRSIRTS